MQCACSSITESKKDELDFMDEAKVLSFSEMTEEGKEFKDEKNICCFEWVDSKVLVRHWRERV